MKKGWYFLVSFLVICLVSISIQAIAQEVVPVQNKIFGFLNDVNVLNIALLAFATFAGGMWALGRSKMKQIGELFLKAYEYTDDKRLSAEERSDLIRRFFQLLGKPLPPENTESGKNNVE